MKNLATFIAAATILFLSFYASARGDVNQEFDPNSFGERLGYKYHVTFDFGEDGKVHVYTDTWIRTSNSEVWIGNPHHDIEPFSNPAAGLLIVPGGCVLHVGRGVQVIEKPIGNASKIERTESMIIGAFPTIEVYHFKTKMNLVFANEECEKP